MTRETTPQDRAAAIVDKVKSALTPIWLGGRQRMLLEQEIAEALTATRRAALLEIADYAKRECCVQCADTDRWQKGHNVAALHIASVCEAKIRELGS